MSCCQDGNAKSKKGSCCGSEPSFPWFSAVMDPVIRRLFFQRYWRELLLGAGSGAVAGLGVLAAGEVLGGVGPLLNGPWLHLHPGVLLPTTVLGGLMLALRDRREGWLPVSAGWMACAALGGTVNGCLEVGASWTSFFQGGGLVSPLAFGILGLPAGWLAWGIAAKLFMGKTRAPGAEHAGNGCCSERPPEPQVEAL